MALNADFNKLSILQNHRKINPKLECFFKKHEKINGIWGMSFFFKTASSMNQVFIFH